MTQVFEIGDFVEFSSRYRRVRFWTGQKFRTEYAVQEAKGKGVIVGGIYLREGYAYGGGGDRPFLTEGTIFAYRVRRGFLNAEIFCPVEALVLTDPVLLPQVYRSA